MKATTLAWATAVWVASLHARQVRGTDELQLVVKIPNNVRNLGPTRMPSDAPSLVPSDAPSLVPSDAPSLVPSDALSMAPSSMPSSLVDTSLNEDSLSDFPSMAPSSVPTTASLTVVPSDVASDTTSQSPSVVPSILPSRVPSEVPSRSPSVVPSAIPSVAPSNIPSNAPSTRPSNMPSRSPSHVPSDVPSRNPSHVPSNVPTAEPSNMPSRNPSHVPSDVPTAQPSNMPSRNPSQIPSDVPTAQPSNMPSRNPSHVPSDVPTAQPSDIPSFQPTEGPSDIPTLVPTETPSFGPSSIPSPSPSATPTKSPTDSPSAAPTAAPTRLLDSLEMVRVTETRVTVQSRSATLMTDEELDQFELICTDQFLPEFLPRVQDIPFEQTSCKVLDQRIVSSSRLLRKLQETDNGATAIDVTTQVSAHADVTDQSFSDIVAGAFDVFSDEFRTMLSSTSSVFVAPSPVEDTDRFASIQNNVQSETEDKDWWKDWSETSLVVLVAAVAGGALLAATLAIFAVSRRRSQTIFRPNFNRILMTDYASSIGMLAGDSASLEEEMDRYNSSEPQSGAIPGAPEIISSGDSVNENIITVKNSPSLHSGEPNKGLSFSKRKMESDISRTLKESNQEYESPVTHLPPLNRSSDEESSLKGLRFVTSIQTSSENSDKRNVIIPFNFGFRRKYNNRSRNEMARYLCKSGSEFSDFTVDSSRPAGTPMASNKVLAKIEECEAVTPLSNFIRQKQTRKGNRFVQMSINDALHTGDVLDDLGKLENEFASRSVTGETRFSSYSAETPKQRNSSRLRPSIQEIMSQSND